MRDSEKKLRKKAKRKLKRSTNKLKEEFESMKAEVQTKCYQDQEELKRNIQDEINQKEIKIDDLDKKLKEKEKELLEIIGKHNEEVKTKDAIIEEINSQEIKLIILNYLYSKTMGSKVDFTNDSELVINLNNEKGKLINEFFKNKNDSLDRLKTIFITILVSKLYF